MVVQDDEIDVEEQVGKVAMRSIELAGDDALDTNPLEEIAEVELHSMVGVGSPKTINLRGLIRAMEVNVLVDSGAIHKFIALKLVHELDLPLSEMDGYGIILGTGSSVRGAQICK